MRQWSGVRKLAVTCVFLPDGEFEHKHFTHTSMTPDSMPVSPKLAQIRRDW